MSAVTTMRRARKTWHCEGYTGTVCVRVIPPGALYLRHVIFPGDIFDTITIYVECLRCAWQTGRLTEKENHDVGLG